MSAIPLEHARRPVAWGTPDTAGRLRVACRFDEATFDEINRLAHASNISFAAQVRILVRAGLSKSAA
jgi:hypothetical protein